MPKAFAPPRRHRRRRRRDEEEGEQGKESLFAPHAALRFNAIRFFLVQLPRRGLYLYMLNIRWLKVKTYSAQVYRTFPILLCADRGRGEDDEMQLARRRKATREYRAK